MLKEVYFQMPYEVVKEPEWKITKAKSACYKYWFDDNCNLSYRNHYYK